MLLANRYLSPSRGAWIDLATGRDVLALIERAGSRTVQLAWSERCAMHSVLRHPLLNPLIDYGAADAERTFEIYERPAPFTVSERHVPVFVTHASRFLSAHGVLIEPWQADYVFRAVARGSTRVYPIGYVLQRRRVLRAIEELLDEPPHLTEVVVVTAPPGGGLRTLLTTTAQLARTRGYLTLSPDGAARCDDPLKLARDRHVCVVGTDVPRVARLASAIVKDNPRRRHVAIAFVPTTASPHGAVRVDPLGVTTMTSMIYIDPDLGPDKQFLFGAAQRSDGWPGRYLLTLGLTEVGGGASVVHEAGAVYGSSAEPSASAAVKGGRLQRVLERAIPRAQELARSGRTSAARRTLERAARIHRGRGQHVDADACLATIAAIETPASEPREVTYEDRTARFLRVAHAAADDRHAVDAVIREVRVATDAVAVALVGRDGRVLAAAGKTWGDLGPVGSQTLAGVPVAVDAHRPPAQAGCPVVLCGDVLGAVLARWTAGAAIDSAAVMCALDAAALAVATHLRALLDTEVTAVVLPAPTWNDLVGESDAARALRDAVTRAARAPFPVLIEGESGSGKELVARAIHRLSSRRDRKVCAINCAALSDDLLEAELFGHARGAFTGAAVDRPGLFEDADGGTLFLDEVGELSARAQAKLLRVLQDGEMRRVGENFSRRVDVRIVAATNRSLADEVTAGRFRADLRFRLDVVRIVVPPLRERVADIPDLAAHFWREAAARVGTQAVLGPDAISALARYDWPGNVRELQNAIAWIAVHAPRRGRVSASSLPARIAASAPLATGSFEAAREEFERRYVRAALAQAGGQRARAAASLGLSRQGLAKMIKRLGLGHARP